MIIRHDTMISDATDLSLHAPVIEAGAFPEPGQTLLEEHEGEGHWEEEVAQERLQGR